MAQTDSERLFTQTAPVRLFLTVAVPGAFGMLLQSVYDVMDGVFVGRFVGENAFAAINLAMPFVIVCFAAGDLIGVGSAVPISIAHGRGERDHANNVFTCACLLNIAFGAVEGTFFLAFAPQLMSAMGAAGDLHAQAVTYLRVYAFFLPVTSICFAADNYLRICGRVSRSLWCNALLAGVGAALEFCLLGLLGFGVGAAALAYCVAIALSAAVAMWPFLRGECELSFVRPHPSLALVGEIVSDGMPAFLENVAGRITSILMNVALLRLGGTDAVSIYGVAMCADALMVPLIYGVMDSLQPAVGYNWGARRLERVRSLEACGFATVCVASLAFVGFVWFFAREITLVFMPGASEAFLDEAQPAVRLFSLSYVARWLPFAVGSYMVAVGQSRLAVIVSVAQSLVCPVVALVALTPLGLLGLWLNMPVSTLAASVLALLILALFRSTARERMGG